MNIQQQLQLLAAELKRQAGPAHVNSTVVGANVSSGIARASRQDPTAPVSSVSESSSNAQLFPYILHALLEDVEKVGPATSIVSWSPDGSSVHVKDQQVFETTILPSYLPHLRGPLAYSKFQSLLKDWGFDQLGAGVFLHPCFQKSNISMCRFMRCGRKEEDQGSVNTHSLQSIFPSQSMPDALSQSSGQSVGIHSSLLQQLQGQPSQTLQLQGLLQGMAAPPSNQHQTEALASLLLSQLLRQAQQQQQPKRSGLQPTVSQHGTTGIAASSLPSAAASLPRAAQTSSVLHSTFAPPAECFPSTNLKTRDVSHAGKVKSVKNPDHDEKPSAAAKRKAFLNKRSHASGTMYRPSEKKRKISAASSSATIFSSTEKTNAPRGKNVFVLNEDFHPGDIPDLLFPWKLHDMLDDAEKNANLKRIISWNDDGVSFSIKDESEFTNGVMTKYFEEKEWDSFTQSLSSWGFVRFTSGAQKGSFIHRLLAKEKRSLCKQMRIRGKAVSELIRNHSQFLVRLHAMLHYADKKEKRSIVSWTNDGKKFTIHDTGAFMNTVFTDYFDTMTYGSFEQKLRRFGFTRSPAKLQNVDKESKMISNATYSHACFQKNKAPSVAWTKSSSEEPSTIRPEHNFLVRLRVMLNNATRDGNQLVVSWLPHGKGFIIHDRSRFADAILPRYFKGKFTGFRQSLRMHGFAQMGGNSWDEGAHYHKLFIRDEPLLCQGLTQEQMKKAMPDYVPSADEPNFYSEQTEEDVQSGQDANLLDAATSIVSLSSST